MATTKIFQRYFNKDITIKNVFLKAQRIKSGSSNLHFPLNVNLFKHQQSFPKMLDQTVLLLIVEDNVLCTKTKIIVRIQQQKVQYINIPYHFYFVICNSLQNKSAAKIL